MVGTMAVVGALATWIWDSRGAPPEKIADVKYCLARCGYTISGAALSFHNQKLLITIYSSFLTMNIILIGII